MRSVNFAVLGDQSIAASFGKKGTATDLVLYDKKESGTIRTWVAPVGFPEKIQPLFQAINLSEFAILYVTALDRFAGEQIVALDVLGKRGGILSHSYDVDEGALEAAVRGTVVGSYTVAAPDEIGDRLTEMGPVFLQGKTKIVIDHCFDVQGVGTVVLGKVVRGSVRQYDTLRLLPSGVQVTVKSIQMHDDPVDEAVSPARVGLSLKGVRPDGVGRGDILSPDDSVNVADLLDLDFVKTPYYKGDIAAGHMCLVNIGLQTVAGKIVSASPFQIKLDRPAVCDDTCVMLKPESAGIRIMGSGRIL